VAGASLDDLRAAVDALKRPRRGEVVGEVSDEEDETGLDEDQAAQEQPAQAESRQ
jgi:hypothetical protein